jgi:hypothetical protein
MLWRIEPTNTATLPHLSDDLALHLRYAPLTSVLVRIGNRQQAYLTGPTCEHCRHRRCGPNCVMQLLRQLLIANRVATDLRPVPLGLSARPYTRLVLAIPGAHAQALAAPLLADWPEARLWISWRTLIGQRIAGAALVVGAAGPDPRTTLHTHGWHAIATQRTTRSAIPAYLPFGWPTQIPPTILLPIQLPTAPIEAPISASHPEPEPPMASLFTSEFIAQATATLTQIAHDSCEPQASINEIVEMDKVEMDKVEMDKKDVGGTLSVGAANPPAPHYIDWPTGPNVMPPERLGQLMACMVQSPSLTEGRPGRVGLAIPRLKQTLGLTKAEAIALLHWLDQAHILDPPIDPQQPWRQPRRLATTDLATIATRLQATPIPIADV